MRKLIHGMLSLLAMMYATGVPAENFRCAGHIIERGVNEAEVKQHCGEPDLTQKDTQQFFLLKTFVAYTVRSQPARDFWCMEILTVSVVESYFKSLDTNNPIGYKLRKLSEVEVHSDRSFIIFASIQKNFVRQYINVLMSSVTKVINFFNVPST